MKRSASRYSVAQAKAQLSAVLRGTKSRPAIIHNRGHDVAVVLSVADYQRLRDQAGVSPITRWLARIEEWRTRTGGVELDAEPMAFEPVEVDLEAPRR